MTTAAAGGLGDSDVEVRRLCANALREAAAALVQLVPDVRTPSPFPPEGRPLDLKETADIRAYRQGVDEEREALKELLDAIMVLARTPDAPLNKALSDPSIAVRVLARNTVEEVALTRQRLLAREESIPAWARAERKKGVQVPPLVPRLEPGNEGRPMSPILEAGRNIVTPPPATGEKPAAADVLPAASGRTVFKTVPPSQEEQSEEKFAALEEEPAASRPILCGTSSARQPWKHWPGA